MAADADCDCAEASLIDALQSCNHRGLYNRFSSFLLPFGELIPLHSHNPKPIACNKGTAITTASKKRGPTKKNPEPDTLPLRPLAKRFLPFISRALKLLPALLRKNHKSLNTGVDEGSAAELLQVYGLLIDCLACIAPCLSGKPYSVHLQRGLFVISLEAWGRYEEAEVEALKLLESFSSVLVEAAPIPKSRKHKIVTASRYLPDPAIVSADDAEVTTLFVEVIVVLTSCAYKTKLENEGAYTRILDLIDQVQPWLRFLDPDSLQKYLHLLVSTLYKCSLFLLEEYIHFEGETVQRFCLKMLTECARSCSIDHFRGMTRKIISSVDLQWAAGCSLLLGILRLTLDSILCSCKVDLLASSDDFLEIVSYFASRICVANVDFCRRASELLYQHSDDVLQVSLPVASILSLYATGLHFKLGNIDANQSVGLHNSCDAFKIKLFNDSEVDLKKLSVLLDKTTGRFHFANHLNEMNLCAIKDSTEELEGFSKSGNVVTCMRTHGRVSLVSYVDAFEFLCKPMVEFVNTAWKTFPPAKEHALHSVSLNYVQKVLHELCDLVLAASSSDMSEKVERRLIEIQATLLQAAVAAFKISLMTDENYQKSLLVINCIISSSLMEPQELKFLISAINNVGAVCYNSGWFEKASKALQLCIEIIWAYIKLICSNHSKQAYGKNTSEDGYKDAIDDALSRIATIIDFLYKSGATNIKEIVVKNFHKLSIAEGKFDYMTGFTTLMTQWVKIILKEFKDADVADNVPVLYLLVLDSHSSLSMEIASKILEQELTVYELMEYRNPNLCQKMQIKVMDLLLIDVYTSTDYNLQRSRVLIRKGRIFRANGTQGLNYCLECLLEAISLLRYISGESSQDSASVAHQLAIAYILHAQCSQEANQDCNVILHNVQCALNIWSGMNVQSYSVNNRNEWKSANALPLLCSVIDMLSLKGCLKFQIEICKLIIRFWMLENESLEKCISLLWTNRRLNHSLCSSPINEILISWISEQFGLNANSLDYWISCMKDHQPSQCMLLQKLLPTTSVFPTSVCSLKTSCAQISVEEVKSVASSLISEVPLTSQSAFVAAYLYHDLSERLFSNGRFFEALPYAREALCLRSKILRRKFIYTVAEESSEAKCDKVTKFRNIHIYLEAVSNSATDCWPEVNNTRNLDDSSSSPWSVLRCYLESTLQVGTICESTGNGTEAEYLFRIGKEISCLQGFSVLSIAFTVLLGQLYRRKQLWDLADNEFRHARKLLMDYDSIISCDHCKTAFEVTIDMQVADLTMNLLGKGIQTKCNASLSHALNLYKLALKKVERASVGNGIDISWYPKVHANKVDSKGVQETRNLCSSMCCICLLLNGHVNFAYGKLHPMQIKKVSTKSLECSEKDINHQSKPRRKRTTGRSADLFPTSNKSNCMNHKLCAEKYSCEELPNELSGTFEADCGGKEDSGNNKIECLRCLIFQVVENGFMNDILYMKRECYHRNLVLMLLLRIAKCLGTQCRKHVKHEVHEVFGRCTSVIFNWKSLECSGMPDSRLIHLIGDERLGDFFRMERAAVLYYMSWFCLKNISEHPRITCCSLSKIHMTTIFRWLLQAFILCQESPLLFQKVSRLLSSMFLLSSLHSSVSLPVKTEEPLSINHWAAYFHQASVGAHLHYQFYSRNKISSNKDIKVFSNSSIPSETAKLFKFFRFSPEKLQDLEENVLEFFEILPSIPIICVSMLGGDYANLIGEMLLLPSFFPAWIFLSRLVANNQPIVILVPVDHIQEAPSEIQLVDISGQRVGDSNAGPVKHWICPWGYSLIDCVLPSFKQLLEVNFLLLSNATFSPADIKTKSVSWWSQRSMLNNFLNKLLRNMQISWLGPWGCLLLGERSVTQNSDTKIHKLISAMKSQGKCKINHSLIKAIIYGSNSVADAESCIQQSLLYKGFFGHGECCGKESFRAFSDDPQEVQQIHDIIKEFMMEFAESVDREPVILVLDSDVQMLPWENLPILRSQEVYRMPSVSSIFITLDRSCSHHKRDKAFGTFIPAIDPLNTYYLLNPSGDLNDTQVEFEQWFRNQEWEGKAGKVPTTEELIVALQSRDLFLYFGHGSGTQYIPEKQISKMDHCAATLLMGCSSGSLIHRGCYASQGAPLSYLFAGSPAVVANLWDVTDKDIDRFGKALLMSWLFEDLDSVDNCSRDKELVKHFGCISINNETSTSSKTRRKVHNKKSHDLFDSNHCRNRNRMASFISQARESCKLPMLVGAAPVCYGVPTAIWKKSES